MESDRTSPADGCTGRRAGGRSPRHQRHRARDEKWLSLVRLPARLTQRVKSIGHRLQSTTTVNLLVHPRAIQTPRPAHSTIALSSCCFGLYSLGSPFTSRNGGDPF